MLPEQTSILIVGAGPTGLAAAISLFNQGCKDIVVVDAAERTPDTSRAMVIHASTLEVGLVTTIINLFVHLLMTGTGISRLRRQTRFTRHQSDNIERLGPKCTIFLLGPLEPLTLYQVPIYLGFAPKQDRANS